MFAKTANINMESVDLRELKLKAGNSCFAIQHGQSDASPSMRADSLLVLRQRCLSKTNKTFSQANHWKTPESSQGPAGSKGSCGCKVEMSSAAVECQCSICIKKWSQWKNTLYFSCQVLTGVQPKPTKFSPYTVPKLPWLKTFSCFHFQLWLISTSWTQSSAPRPSWAVPLMKPWRAATLWSAVMGKV